jgi:hypothetical protein
LNSASLGGASRILVASVPANAAAEQCLESVDRLGEGVPSRVIDSKVTK